MKARVSKKQRFFNQINLTVDDDLYIGIDVHKTTYHIALYLNGDHAIDFITPADNDKVCQTLKKLQPAIKMIVYEAGPTGYSLARRLQQASLWTLKWHKEFEERDYLILSSVKQLEYTLDQYQQYYHHERIHQLLGRIIEPKHNNNDTVEIKCIERLGGLLKSYHRLAA